MTNKKRWTVQVSADADTKEGALKKLEALVYSMLYDDHDYTSGSSSNLTRWACTEQQPDGTPRAEVGSMLFFGVIGRAGHYWHGEGKPRFGEVPAKGLTFPDGAKGYNDLFPGGFPGTERRIKFQVQGASKLTHKSGWTVLAWWDRGGPDKRMGCNSSLWAEGTWSFDEMIAAGVRDWPQVMVEARMPMRGEGA